MNPDPAQLPEQNSSPLLDLQTITVEARATLTSNPLQPGVELPLESAQLEASPEDPSPADPCPSNQEPNLPEDIIQEKKPVPELQPAQPESLGVKNPQPSPPAFASPPAPPQPQPTLPIQIAIKKNRIQLNKKMKNAGYRHLSIYDENRKTS